MDWFEPVRAYCERTGGEFWAEPVNALSNAAFLIAAAAGARRAARTAPPDRAGLALSGLVAIVGIGSFLFHTLAVFWSMLADVIPIALFIYAYLALALLRYLRVPPIAVAGMTAAFALIGLSLTPVLNSLTGRDVAVMSNGSIDYLPALLALFGMAAATIGRPEERITGTGRRLAGIGVLFLVSLTARTLDRSACTFLPIGTHALWHLLNAAVLYALVATAIRHRQTVG
ncbi:MULTISPECIES: ceramidase domain-containing protein [unclassified Methylobacterium]|uniref:ceramidase domain-containing protein n=1 Tax=unclassified Methylobacterium TaxID=2615210 RepID=UPI001FBA3B22|nr:MULTISPECIES: ceramidase domain-containing protein [unclassified Methylobacterium]MCJ2018183.1 ceramidase domain-containing protein [Methylobacterium sp. E-065]